MFFRRVNVCHGLNCSLQQTRPDVDFLLINSHFLVQEHSQLRSILPQPHMDIEKDATHTART